MERGVYWPYGEDCVVSERPPGSRSHSPACSIDCENQKHPNNERKLRPTQPLQQFPDRQHKDTQPATQVVYNVTSSVCFVRYFSLSKQILDAQVTANIATCIVLQQ